MFRIGQSRDVHRFIKDGETKKGLVLGTVKISDEIINEINLGYVTNCLAIPVFKHDKLVNVVRYKHG